MRTILGAGILAALLSGCGGYDTIMPPSGAVPGNGTLGGGVAGAVTLNRGSSAPVTITVARPTGFTGAIDLSAETLPTGITASFNPETVAAGATTSVLTLAASSTATTGTSYPVVRARGAGVGDATVMIVMNVNP